jgi:hypothetical protein
MPKNIPDIMGTTAWISGFEDHPNQKSETGRIGAPIQAIGSRLYSSTVAQSRPAFRALEWYVLYSENNSRAITEPSKTKHIVRNG